MFNKEMVMNVITEYVISKEAGALDTAYFRIMGDYSRLRSPWESLWRQVSPLYNEYIKKC